MEECKAFHKASRVWTAVVSALLSIFVMACLWSVTAGYHATTRAAEVDGRFDVHEAKQELETRMLQDQLDRLESTIQELTAELRKLREGR